MVAQQLTKGGLRAICLEDQTISQPVFQILGFKKVPGGQALDRYRLLLSDSVNVLSSAMLATQLNKMIESGELKQFCIVEVGKYLCNQVQDRKVLILLELRVLQSGDAVGSKIGDPQALNTTMSGNATQQRQEPAQPQNQYQSLAKPAAPAPQQAPQTRPSFYGSSVTPNKPYGMGGGAAGGIGGRNLPTTPGGSSVTVHPIAALTPYQNKWTIKARVTNKSSIRTWNNSRGEGKLFSMDLLDQSGEIRATAFKAECDKFYDIIEVGKVYYISKGTLKTANKQFSNLNNDYEMTFNTETSVVRCDDDDDSTPSVQFNFTTIDGLQQVQKDTMVDVIGVCKTVGDVQTFISRQTNKELTKRDVFLVDQSNCTVQLTLWGEKAEQFDGNNNPVVCVRNARVSDFSGVSLSAVSSSLILVNPDIQQAFELRGWFDHGGADMEARSLSDRRGGGDGGANSNWKTFQQVKEQNLGQGDKPEYITVKGTIMFLKSENCMYKACPTESCNKKVVDLEKGQFRCEKCSETFNSFKWRLMLSVHIADHTDAQWVMCFQDTAEKVLGITAAELGELRENNSEQFDNIFAEANFKSYVFRLRCKFEFFNDENRQKLTAVGINPVEYEGEYGKRLEEDMQELKLI